MMTYTLFIIDDEDTIRDGLTMAFESDYQIHSFRDAESAMDAIQNEPPDLILLDIGLPGMSGSDALAMIKKISPDSQVIMITAYEDIHIVVSTMKSGAYDYILKPIQLDSLEITMGNALESIRLKKEVKLLQEKYIRDNQFCFIGDSKEVQGMMDLIEKIAKSPDTPILILGETGTGKELIAGAIHYRSPHFKGQLVTVNCAAIPSNLLESELFGYEKGAFSGANALGKKGMIEAAEGGTLFLDEIGDLSLESQAKVLRFLENGEFYRIGGTTKRSVKTRVVSATNRNLEEMIDNGLFRRDLYFRIGVIKLRVASLNERHDDILPIATYYLDKFAKKFGKKITGFSKPVQDMIIHYNWTGNVRELKNSIERGVLVGTGPELQPQDLGLEMNVFSDPHKQQKELSEFNEIPKDGIDLSEKQDALERYYIKEALKKTGGNESQAAKLLNINHHTFRYRKKKYQI